MDKVDRNASASAFGWQFQINAAIFMMIKYFGSFNMLKVEGEKEDIEISFNNNKKIYAQAKAKQFIDYENTNGYSSKLSEALTSLSDVDNEDIEKLIYVSNLEPHPLNVNNKEFELVSFLRYNELTPESKQKIDKQLDKIESKIDKDKLIIAKIPFYGEDKSTRHKYITSEIEKFLAIISGDLIPYSQRLLETWETEFLHNATQKNMNLKIKKDEVLWKLLVFKLENNSTDKFDEKMQIDEEDYYNALDRYDKVINYKEGKFEIYNKISQLILKAQKINNRINSIDFIINYSDEIYDIVFKNNKNTEEELIERACAKIIARRIFLKKRNLSEILERAKKYEN